MSKKAYKLPITHLLSLPFTLMMKAGSQHTDESLGRKAEEWDDDDPVNSSRRQINVWEEEEEDE